ncbi:hypothetical protein BRARA_H00411 [Brassica rapa]|uniref:Knottin scorpion toxin-like domain-containing protein n=1 Tax=Brassica campestris TaxID=3711 RepID=A0A397YI72_BRACM|nr:hypothetical protein BRARA_H00411 [Brassica rapa]
MRKSLQLLFTFLTVFIILSLGMMTDAQKKETKLCSYKISHSSKQCFPILCRNECKKKYPPSGSGVCSDSKGFCDCNAPCKGSR